MSPKILATAAFVFLFVVGSNLAAANVTTVTRAIATADALWKHYICRNAIARIAERFFRVHNPGDTLFVGVERTFSDLVRALDLTPTDRARLDERMSKLQNQQLRSAYDVFLAEALEVLEPTAPGLNYAGAMHWLCFGKNCSGDEPPTAFLVPFNFVVRDFDQLSKGTDLSPFIVDVSSEVPNGKRIPYPSLGLSGVTPLFFNRPDLTSEESTDTWLLHMVREAEVHAVYKLLSEWLSKNHFGKLGSPSQIVDPWYKKFIRQEGPEGRTYVIDPIFFHILMAGSKYLAEEEALRALGRWTQAASDKLRQKAYQQVLDNSNEISRARFTDQAGTALTNENIYSFAYQLSRRMHRFTNRFVVERTLQTYPDPSLGIVPIQVRPLINPTEATLDGPRTPFPYPRGSK